MLWLSERSERPELLLLNNEFYRDNSPQITDVSAAKKGRRDGDRFCGNGRRKKRSMSILNTKASWLSSDTATGAAKCSTFRAYLPLARDRHGGQAGGAGAY